MVCHTDVSLSTPCKGNRPKQAVLTSLVKVTVNNILLETWMMRIRGKSNSLLHSSRIRLSCHQERSLLCSLEENAVWNFYLSSSWLEETPLPTTPLFQIFWADLCLISWFCYHQSTLLWSLHLLPLPHHRDGPTAPSLIGCSSNLSSDCSEDMCKKAVRSLTLCLGYLGAWPTPGHVRHCSGLIRWFDFSARPQICLLTKNLLAIWALAGAWLPSPESSLPLQLPESDQESAQQVARLLKKLVLDSRVLKHLPGFFSPLSLSTLLVLSLPSRIQINYIWRYLRCCLYNPFKLLTKIIIRK